MKEDKKRYLNNMSDHEKDFYLQCAIAAMQGMQETGKKISIMSDMFPNQTAKLAFRMADAMLDEYYNHINNIVPKTNDDWLEKRQLKLDFD